MSLTPEQRERMERNRALAEEKKRSFDQHSKSTSAAPPKQKSLLSFFSTPAKTVKKEDSTAVAAAVAAVDVASEKTKEKIVVGEKSAITPVAAPTTTPVLKKSRPLTRRDDDNNDDDDDDDDVHGSAATASVSRKKKARVISSDDEADDEPAVKVDDDHDMRVDTGVTADANLSGKLALFEYADGDDGTNAAASEWQSVAEQNAPRKKLRFERPGAQYDENDTTVRNVHDNVKKPEWLARRLDRERRAPGTEGYDETTLYIPQSDFAQFSDMMKQYWRYKCDHMDELVFLQWGTFYELLWCDADVAVRELGIAYTNRATMNLLSAGVPLSGWEKHVQTLVKRGYVVTLLSQGDKVEGQKVVDRSVTLKASLGTLCDESWLPDAASGYVMCVKELHDGAGDNVRFGVCLVDTSTNECRIGSFVDDSMRCRLDALLMQTNVRELLLEKQAATLRTRTVARQHVTARLTHFLASFVTPAASEAVLALHFSKPESGARPAQIAALDEAAAGALGTMLQFLRTAGEGNLDEQVLGARDFRPLQVERGGEQLFVDGAALRHLGVLPPPSDPTATHGTLLGFVDRCLSPFGRRLLQQWLAHPLRSIAAIEARLDAVDELMASTANAGDGDATQALRALLGRLPDLERRVAALASGRLRAGEFVALIDAMESVVEQLTRRESAGLRATLLRANVAAAVEGLGAVVARASALFDRASAGKGASANVVPLRGADAAFDACRDALTAREEALEKHLEEQREALGSRSLKYWHPKGKTANTYQIEVPSKVSVPGNWEKKSSKAGTDRYHSPFIVAQLPELERLTAEHDALVSSTLSRVQRACVAADFAALRSGVRALAELDVLQAFARATSDATVSGPMCRPRFEDESARGAALFRCRALRHPCLPDGTLTTGAPVPNDVWLDGAVDSAHPPLALLTGANMGGKTTLLRQVCLAVLLAQCGCYVPAIECQMTPVDAVLTRLGASDNILAGQSTFMVELLETGAILRHATQSSLVILDELGRGTSTHDGLAIAYAVIDALAARRCRTLFATHYHLLTATYAGRPHDVALWSMRVALERGSDGAVGRIVPLYQLAIGAALNSFGAECALMAGVPQEVVERAAVIAQEGDQLGRDRFVVDTMHTLAALLQQPDDDAASAKALRQIGAQVRHLTQS